MNHVKIQELRHLSAEITVIEDNLKSARVSLERLQEKEARGEKLSYVAVDNQRDNVYLPKDELSQGILYMTCGSLLKQLIEKLEKQLAALEFNTSGRIVVDLSEFPKNPNNGYTYLKNSGEGFIFLNGNWQEYNVNE